MVIDYRKVLAHKTRAIANHPDKVSVNTCYIQIGLSGWMKNDPNFNNDDLLELLID